MSDQPAPRDAAEAPLIAPAAPAAAAVVFGDRLAVAEAFAAILADTGVSHGLIGPREVPILWERHILNCAVVHEAFPEGAAIVDVGSGAGLPGLALAIARPDLHLHLVEPMLRRTTWLSDTIEALGLTNCTVHRGRAEEFHGVLSVEWATARAVARIDKLARWTFPLLAAGGTLVALKGSSADDELEAAAPLLRKLGMVGSQVQRYGGDLLEVPTVTLELVVKPRPATKAEARRAKKATRPGTASRRDA
ncbi:16S rRNA (guanine(527)-N(7))-methyltransferase RsmG [Phycicoccus sp. Root101]|uniref:16S rRNA (guanine(527)-N(7))-methyltransferase RsmG n=1 Tax=Phycicoccus sp. Root101 TaxID=1736421 RepID=UPI00070335EA|nr:16S rRNA (guanine(527)-N(7))-methyltransferase RsmG [Phycicoccus sp. Root101]KQU68222.1 16S rRNA (guanine(527)-N(7))-methyltransferase RsmG [Phycicoccus sp. Root101]